MPLGRMLRDYVINVDKHNRSFADLYNGIVEGNDGEGYANVTWPDYNAQGDGGTDDTAAIQAAIDAIATYGGGVVDIPTGTYLVTGLTISSQDKVLIRGAGVGATIIRLANSSNDHVVAFTTATDCGIFNLSIDGNGANQNNGVHGLRIAGVTGFTGAFLKIYDCDHYGIGAQAGTMTHVRLFAIDIEDCGGDGIDFKNVNDDNSDVQLENISIRQWGQNTANAAQAGIDVRGPMTLSNIVISDPGANDALGIEFESGELLATNGLGGHKSVLQGFDIRMGSATTGIAIRCKARDVVVANGYITGGFRGIDAQELRFHCSNVTVEATSQHGVYLEDVSPSRVPDYSTLVSVKAYDCGGSGIIIEGGNCTLLGCYAHDNNKGIDVQAEASGTVIVGGHVSGNTVTDIEDSGTSTKFRAIGGYVTENSGSSSIANGTTSTVITHGLSISPVAGDISVIGGANPTNDVGTIWVSTFSSTNFTVNVENDPGASGWNFSWKAARV